MRAVERQIYSGVAAVVHPPPSDEDLDDDEQEDEEYDGKLNWKDSKVIAEKFYTWIWMHKEIKSVGDDGDMIDLTMIERDRVGKHFERFFQQQLQAKDQKRRKRVEGLVMAMLRKQKKMKSKAYSDGVVFCSFALLETNTFAPMHERKTKREEILERHKNQQADKGGVEVGDSPLVTNPPNLGAVLPMNQDVTLHYPLSVTEVAQKPIQLIFAQFVGGSQKKCYQVKTNTPLVLDEEDQAYKVELSFRSGGIGVRRASLRLVFRDATNMEFSILRNLLSRTGDADMYDILKPKTPFVKRKRRQRVREDKPVKKENVVDPPKPSDRGDGFTGYKNLKPFKVPIDIRELVESREIEGLLESLSPLIYDDDKMQNEKEFTQDYSKFWQHLLWVSELQANEDIKLFDMENATLQRHGRMLKLYVAGLAEGRPSVLRGDIVECHWNGKKYRGRVFAVELLDVILEFHGSFHKKFDVKVDRVDRIRFTFTRTAFRTSHVGSLRAPKRMGQRMLKPTLSHVTQIESNRHQNVQRQIPKEGFSWASQTINEEQKNAVEEIVKGTLSPMPYIIFGPAGTGKTTTLVEAVYQLARVHINAKQQPKLKILLVAPSNDATDIMVEKLAPYFPPSEMIRVLAYTRSITDVPAAVRPYVREGLEPSQLGPEVMDCQITVSTVNLASRLWCLGNSVPSNHFDVLCLDEAGHATEPELIGVAATMMTFRGRSPGQLVLAGDHAQLGPIITSDLCKKFRMGMSYMERLITTSPAYNLVGEDKVDGEEMSYSPELVTMLVRNYRSHPAILKLPNEMFYHNKLNPSGDKLTTHNMVKWEHLPSSSGFPVIFHGVDGENLREGNSPSWFNPEEAMEVVNYVKLLVKHSKPPIRQEEIGVITPYARQVQKIRLALKANDFAGDAIKVGSVETFQGQERRVIIISTVRSESNLLEHDRKYNLGFVANEKRFNVAVTRAKALLVVVGNPRVLATDEKNWLPFLRYCRDNHSWMGEEWIEGAESDESDDQFVVVDDDDDDDDADGEEEEDEWYVLADQEACGFINREE